ncbi:MAG TPA: hypothetical protein VJA18_05380 [Candidatus Nanoarchaeia archaeon]|nr:hypothetical protein [Candidatus Nanoarchaeia archaeon]
MPLRYTESMAEPPAEVPKPRTIEPPVRKLPEPVFKSGFDEPAYQEANSFMEWMLTAHRDRSSFQQPFPSDMRTKLDELWDLYLPQLQTSLDTDHLPETVRGIFLLKNIDNAFGKTSSEAIEFICTAVLEKLGTERCAEVVSTVQDMGRLDFLQAAMSNRLKDNPELNKNIRSQFLTILEGHGLDGEEILRSWLQTGKPGERKLLENMGAVLRLEKRKPGVTKVLFDEFNIRNFGRYPVEALLSQAEELDDRTTPYGMLIYPLADWNQAFFEDVGTIGHLYRQLLQLGYNLRISESENKLDLVHSLNRARKRFGPMQFAVIGGHGDRDHIEFGRNDRGNLSVEDFSTKGARATSLAFVDDPTIVLISCSTGQKGGVAQQISQLGGEVIAPDQTTGINMIEVSKSKIGRLVFNVIYQEEAAVKFTRGKQVKV